MLTVSSIFSSSSVLVAVIVLRVVRSIFRVLIRKIIAFINVRCALIAWWLGKN